MSNSGLRNISTRPKNIFSVQQIVTRATSKEKDATRDQMDTNADNN